MVRQAFAGALLAVISLAACGGGGSSGGGVAPTTPTATPNTTATPNSPASMPQSGTVGSSTVLVGQNGHTLYVLSSDPANTSTCTATGGCTGVWPPYAAPAGTVAPAGGSFGIITRSDGTLQWTNGTAPLYEYSGDTAAGTAAGQGITSFGGTWTAAQPAVASPGPTPNNPYIHRRP
jgi:predicted lipoprotein with Yx(FWY)xxD motif